MRPEKINEDKRFEYFITQINSQQDKIFQELGRLKDHATYMSKMIFDLDSRLMILGSHIETLERKFGGSKEMKSPTSGIGIEKPSFPKRGRPRKLKLVYDPTKGEVVV